MLKLDVDPRPRIRMLDVTTHSLVATHFMGDYASVFKGRGVVFENYREYTSSDDASLIDWKGTLRAGKTVVKEFVEERNLDVFFLVDASHTMVFGSQARLKHEYAAEMVAAMGFAILQRGDAVGVGLFSDTVHGFLAPQHGMAQYRRLLHTLTDPAYYDGPCNFEDAVKVCLHRLAPNTVIILVTDMVQMEGVWERVLKIAGRKFELVPIVVRDPRDDELPAGVGQIMVEDAGSGEQLLIDTERCREAYAREAKRVLERNVEMLHRARMTEVAILSTKEDFPKGIVKYFERRKRRWR